MSGKTGIAIVGGGLAGAEAAWQLARRGLEVHLYEQRPQQGTPAHRTGGLAELVCSNSLKSTEIENAHGLLKAELQILGAKLPELALQARVPAGSALAVDRDRFSQLVEQELAGLPSFHLHREQVKTLAPLLELHKLVILSSGPLTEGALANDLAQRTGSEGLYFYDAIAPVVEAESLDKTKVFAASRWGKGEADYLNCPLTAAEYHLFVEALLIAEKVPFKDFEQAQHFEGCLPIEVMAARGPETLAFGPFKPVGLERGGNRFHAVVQLRQENQSGSLYNLVGCQTRMTFKEQKRVFRLLPGLEQAEFARLGSMHRNSFLNAPKLLAADLSLKQEPRLLVAGQLTGVEGYVESMAAGLWAALQAWARLQGLAAPLPERTYMLGGLLRHLQEASPDHYQPMNANFGLLQGATRAKRQSKEEYRKAQAAAALAALQAQPWLAQWRNGTA